MSYHSRVRHSPPLAVALAVALAAALALDPAPAGAACPIPPPPVRDLDLARLYTDAAGSETDPERLAGHIAATRPVRSFLEQVVRDADASLTQATPTLGTFKAKCALEHLSYWAKGGALLGTISTKQGEAEQRWTLAGAALAYLKVRGQASREERETIEPWLTRLATAARATFDDRGVKRNNHWYWLGLGLAATALATGEESLWSAARGVMEDAAGDVRTDGTLPLELERRSRALHYHAFALMPLMTLAELARLKGENWEALGNGALGRLADTTIKGAANPELFRTLAGADQEQPPSLGAGWLPLYLERHPEAAAPADIETPSGHRWLGGNVLLLAKALAP